MQYHQTLPLADKEVVLTFDDGPLPRYSNPDPRHSRRAVREGHVFPDRQNGAGLSRCGAPDLRRRAHHRDAHRGSSRPIAKGLARKDAAGDRRWHRRRRHGARRCHGSGAVFPHPRPRALRHHRRGASRAFAGRLQCGCGRRRLAPPHQAGRDRPPRHEPSTGARQGHFAAPRHSSGNARSFAGTARRS